MHRPFVTILAVVVLICGCKKSQPEWNYPVAPTGPRLAALPQPDVATLPSEADSNEAGDASADSEIVDAITTHLGKNAPKWFIYASRQVEDYTLLWITFPEIADGGIDLIYSAKTKRIEWHFRGGYRG